MPVFRSFRRHPLYTLLSNVSLLRPTVREKLGWCIDDLRVAPKLSEWPISITLWRHLEEPFAVLRSRAEVVLDISNDGHDAPFQVCDAVTEVSPPMPDNQNVNRRSWLRSTRTSRGPPRRPQSFLKPCARRARDWSRRELSRCGCANRIWVYWSHRGQRRLTGTHFPPTR
jgi:hypothetical protein